MAIKLHMIRIRFNTFTFEKITKAVKANWIDKFSYFGGTAGIFNGFSIICMFEFLVLVIHMCIKPCICVQSKDKESNIVKVQSNEKENQETDDEIRKELENTHQKCLATQQSLIMTNYLIKENRKKFEFIERELKVKRLKLEAVNRKMKNILIAKKKTNK